MSYEPYNNISYNIGATVLRQRVEVQEVKRTYSTVELNVVVEHFITGTETNKGIDFTIFTKDEDGNKNILFFSQLNPEYKVLEPNNDNYFSNIKCRIIVNDIPLSVNNLNIYTGITYYLGSDIRSSFNDNLISVPITSIKEDPKMEAPLNIEGVSNNDIIPYFNKTITLKWKAAKDYVDINSSNGYILSSSLDMGKTWRDHVIDKNKDIQLVNDECVYKNFNIEDVPNDSSIIFKIKCYNDEGIESNEIRSKIIYKCKFIPVSNLQINLYDEEGNLQKKFENTTKLIDISFKSAACVNLNNVKLRNTIFHDSIIFPENDIIYHGKQPISKYEFSDKDKIPSTDITSINILVIDDIDNIGEDVSLYLLRSSLDRFMNGDLVKNFNFVIQTRLGEDEYELVEKESFFTIDLFNHQLPNPDNDDIINGIKLPYNLKINKEESTAIMELERETYLVPDGENYIKLSWGHAENIYNNNDTFLYDVYIGKDDIFTYENTTINNFYNYKMEKLDKQSKLSFYIVARNKYTSVKKYESTLNLDVYHYDKPRLCNLNIERTANTCNVTFAIEKNTSLNVESLKIIEFRALINGEFPIITEFESSDIKWGENKTFKLTSLEPEKSYTVTLEYTDLLGSKVTDVITIPPAKPIMEITQNCITMGGAEIDNDYILNVKGNVQVDGSLVVNPHLILTTDDINSFKNSGTYTCNIEVARQIVHMLPLSEPGTFNLVVVGGLIPIQFLIYTQYKGDNNIYMRNFFEDGWSEWVLLHSRI